uniref:Uncharacterized protein n=1 Tax=Tetranychus urticae TaxID=32264 RepID=T1KGI9_TETUR
MSNSYGADNIKMIKFGTACNVQSGIQCILSSESFLWIVFSYESDAQKFLPKVKIMYPDAVISELPIDLLSKCPKNSYTVESCEEMVANRVPSSVASLDVLDDTDWNIFFRYNPDFIVPVLNYEPTKWSLLYNLFEKLYDLGAKKVIFDGNFYCAHFESDSAYRDAFERIRSRYLEPLEFVPLSEIRNKQRFKEKMDQYKHDIPWCLNEQLGLCCLYLDIKSSLHDHFMEISKNILGDRECIFIKSTQGRICIGFPDGVIRKSKEIREFLESFKIPNGFPIAKPSNKLLKSISFRDLAGDAYDLAFLSSQLEDSKPITRTQIMKRIRLQRMQEQECNETISQFIVFGKFCDRWDSALLSLEQVVKIFVKLSKVIPLAVAATYNMVNLMYNSWHEAHAAQHFINSFPPDEIPYFRKFEGTSHVQQSSYSQISNSLYYIINDKRKVLEKIVQNKSLVDKLDSNLSTVQSTTDVLDEGMIKKLQYIFVITVNSDFKFTSGMISMIKVNLIQMDCLACIEFEDKIWVAFDDLKKGNKAKANINKIKFILLHEKDEDDFEVGVVMESIQKSPPIVTKMLANKLMDPKTSPRNIHWKSDPFPLGHFNYSYRKAVGMSTSRRDSPHESFSPYGTSTREGISR